MMCASHHRHHRHNRRHRRHHHAHIINSLTLSLSLSHTHTHTYADRHLSSSSASLLHESPRCRHVRRQRVFHTRLDGGDLEVSRVWASPVLPKSRDDEEACKNEKLMRQLGESRDETKELEALISESEPGQLGRTRRRCPNAILLNVRSCLSRAPSLLDSPCMNSPTEEQYHCTSYTRSCLLALGMPVDRIFTDQESMRARITRARAQW